MTEGDLGSGKPSLIIQKTEKRPSGKNNTEVFIKGQLKGEWEQGERIKGVKYIMTEDLTLDGGHNAMYR